MWIVDFTPTPSKRVRSTSRRLTQGSDDDTGRLAQLLGAIPPPQKLTTLDLEFVPKKRRTSKSFPAVKSDVCYFIPRQASSF